MTVKEAIKNIEDILSADIHYDESIDYLVTSDDIEWLEMAKEALERAEKKKPELLTYEPLIDAGWKYACPSCKCAVGKNKYADYEYIEPYADFCDQCGQALDWKGIRTA